jgi:predicted nucleic acid-binding protein
MSSSELRKTKSLFIDLNDRSSDNSLSDQIVDLKEAGYTQLNLEIKPSIEDEIINLKMDIDFFSRIKKVQDLPDWVIVKMILADGKLKDSGFKERILMVKYLLETDVLVDYLTSNDKNYLINLMHTGICFTTVLNAAELLAACQNDNEKYLVRSVLDSLKVLGLHSRYALSIPEFADKTENVRDALFAVVSLINKLPIVTMSRDRYKKTNLKIIHPQEVGV